MARILGAVASSHTPTIGFALDTHKQAEPAWAPIFAGYKPVQEWLAASQPDDQCRARTVSRDRRHIAAGLVDEFDPS